MIVNSVVILVFFLGITWSNPLKGETERGFSLEITTDKSECRLGDSIEVTYILRNTTKDRTIQFWEFYPNDLQLAVTDDSGKILRPWPWTDWTSDEPIGPGQFQGLIPGCFWGGARFVGGNGTNQHYPFKQGHAYYLKYLFSCHRKTQLLEKIEKLSLQEKERFKFEMKELYPLYNVWEGEVESNTVKIRIIK